MLQYRGFHLPLATFNARQRNLGQAEQPRDLALSQVAGFSNLP